jgi:hypothetical protein
VPGQPSKRTRTGAAQARSRAAPAHTSCSLAGTVGPENPASHPTASSTLQGIGHETVTSGPFFAAEALDADADVLPGHLAHHGLDHETALTAALA